MEKSQITLVVFLLFGFLVSANAVYNINVVNYGAKTDGKTDSTKAFLSAWNLACSKKQSVKIYVPKGSYKVLGNTLNWIFFYKVTGLSISGGTLDAQGASFWACRQAGKSCPPGARSLSINFGTRITIKGLTSINSQVAHITINNCNNLLMQGLKIVAPDDSPNTDGIHVQLSTGVTITGTTIKTGDDCVSIGPGTRNLWIEASNCGPGHGISIGSLGKDKVERGVQNVTVKNVVFTGSDNGLRIKSWARPSNGFVTGVLYQDIIMRNVRNPILIDQHYCPRNENCPGQESGIKISQVTYRNIQGSSSSQVAIKFDCSRTNPCKGIRLHTVKLTYQNTAAKATCLNANGATTGLILPESCL
ncbi:polygalacturonase-like [Thalictrum thalictroides]|uniref:Polygalacturonase-like n=1 Tax=Thalictrum thalictroides TaxID=46969 RepID=A0A7J6VZE6_THATH|nr:polygalacturonase-like [Thalictrum thalictroides]